MARHVVAALAAEPVPPFELAVAAEVFGLDRPELGVPWYDFRVCAATPGPIGTKAGFTIQACDGLDTLARADTVVIPGWKVGTQPPEEILDAVRTAHRRGARVISVCSGAFVLAAAGLLDGRPATTHWMYAERLAADYPAIRVDPRVLYI